jgi:single-stranded DNA-binding protein
LSIRSYETKEGEKRKATEVVLNTMQMLDRPGNRSNGEGGERTYAAAGARNGASAGAADADELDEEIPF